MEHRKVVGRAVVEAALSAARRHAGTAAMAAALVPLGAVAAHALVALPGATETQQGFSSFPTSTGLADVIDYTFTSNGGFYNEIELPEVTAGDLNFNISAGSGSLLPFGWTATENLTSQLGSTALKSGSAAAYVLLSTQINPLSSGDAPRINFYAEVPTLSTVPATFALSDNGSGGTTIDPGVPDTTAVPEPASLATMGAGLLAALTVRRRRKDS